MGSNSVHVSLRTNRLITQCALRIDYGSEKQHSALDRGAVPLLADIHGDPVHRVRSRALRIAQACTNGVQETHLVPGAEDAVPIFEGEIARGEAQRKTRIEL